MLIVREAAQTDLEALLQVRNSRKQFEDYLERSDGDAMHFLVCERDGQVVAFSVLYLRQPPRGRLAADLPRISDLYVSEMHRSTGIGSAFIGQMELLASSAGYDLLYISVDPKANPRAAALYERLGYFPLTAGPYRKVALWEDEEGRLTEIEYWRMDLVKQLRP